MKKVEGKWMTAGQFAERAEVTVRTIRFYDKVGLLHPSSRSNNGYRLYTELDLARLQRILTLKYIGFSIDEIKRVINRDGQEEEDLKESLRVQKTIIRRKMEHLRLVEKAVTETLETLDGQDGQTWNRFVSIIRVVNLEEKWVEQYQDATHLHTRIRLHDRFSTNPTGWYWWLFDQLRLPDTCRILELGCGDGTLWRRNSSRIPPDWDITLTDFTEGMLNDARDNLDTITGRFRFARVDARSIPFPDNSFDAVLANHMFYHVNERAEAFREIRRVLRPGGKLYASTIGQNHLLQMKRLLAEFDPKLVLSEMDFASEFGLENGEAQLADWFESIRLRRFDDNLRVTEAEPLLAYIRSTTGNTRDILSGSRLPLFLSKIQEIMTREGAIHIDKESGLFESIKPI